MKSAAQMLPVTLTLLAVVLPGTLAAQDGELGETIPYISLPAEFDRVLRDYEERWESGDGDGLTELFTEDGFVLSNQRRPARGRDAIRGRYDDPSGDLVLKALAYGEGGGVGYIVGLYAYGEAPDQGKFLLALRQDQSGRWLIAADMDNNIQRR
jgi:ketosteroid isomerase-like protein